MSRVLRAMTGVSPFQRYRGISGFNTVVESGVEENPKSFDMEELEVVENPDIYNKDNSIPHSSKYGDLASENIDSYFYYGLALMASNTSEDQDPIASLFPGLEDNYAESESSEQESQEDNEPVVQDQTENEENKPEDSINKDETLDDSKNEEKNENETTFEDSIANNSQVAWEMFEILTKILNKFYLTIIFRDTVLEEHIRLEKLAKVHLNLAQISLESGNFDEALIDVSKSMEIRNNPVIQSADRGMAECHYFNGLIHVESKEFDLAKNDFMEAIKVLESIKTCDSEEEISKLVQELDLKEFFIKIF
ncbi:uncharacterized protein LOC115230395 [Octopus sinensis]|uniref:Uncharacterized protein LOC115230395 n=1 Tax=Octopus sinensis TaxID=2607531 RepID=A0A6P7U646_9MOLL|nr:uncharacterized protein LOC115230395 [Octopus sinensis]